MVMTQLFPAVDIEVATKGFLPPAKFAVEKFSINTCAGAKHETVKFEVKSTESVEIVPQHLTLASASEMAISWKFKEQITLNKLDILVDGKTSVGKD